MIFLIKALLLASLLFLTPISEASCDLQLSQNVIDLGDVVLSQKEKSAQLIKKFSLNLHGNCETSQSFTIRVVPSTVGDKFEVGNLAEMSMTLTSIYVDGEMTTVRQWPNESHEQTSLSLAPHYPIMVTKYGSQLNAMINITLNTKQGLILRSEKELHLGVIVILEDN